jgi:hypothetical protein
MNMPPNRLAQNYAGNAAAMGSTILPFVAVSGCTPFFLSKTNRTDAQQVQE